MDPLDRVIGQISESSRSGRSLEAVRVASYYFWRPHFATSLIFSLNAAHAVACSELPEKKRRKLLVRYLKLATMCANYHESIEREFWYMQAGVANDKAPHIALMLYRWVIELQRQMEQKAESKPDLYMDGLVEPHVRRIKRNNPGIVADTLQRLELVK